MKWKSIQNFIEVAIIFSLANRVAAAKKISSLRSNALEKLLE